MLRTEGDAAIVLLEGGKSCKGCGAAKIGLCRAAGSSMMVTTGNPVGARSGDKVLIGIDKHVRRKGYSLAYLLPLFSFIAGSFAGYVAGDYFSIPNLDAVTGFFSFFATSFFTYIRLRRLDSSCRMSIRRVLSEGTFVTDMKSDEELRYESYRAMVR